jgi:diaminohydroxyphosphoribosylaminopyrimidine deaminase/5-amino-6-(5-phosphoribosylamino)uracil reductase
MAILQVTKGINHQAKGATLYVTLEPCAHQGKTPPCTQAMRVIFVHLALPLDP